MNLFEMYGKKDIVMYISEIFYDSPVIDTNLCTVWSDGTNAIILYLNPEIPVLRELETEGHYYSYTVSNKGDSMLENPSFSDIIDLICSFCDDPENITAYDRSVYDIHLKDECQQKLNEAIKNASNDVLIEVIKDGRSIPTHHHYCTYSEIFLLEDLAIEELTNRGMKKTY